MKHNFGLNSFLLGVLSVFALSSVIKAQEPVVWATNTRADVLKGDARGVSIAETGAISLAPRLDQTFDTGQSFVWSSAADSNGNVYLGTGNDGKLFRIAANGQGILFADFNELDVTAVAVARDNTIYAATSPDGKVYRLDSAGKATTYFDPTEKYIWSLAILNDNSLAIGSGENGRIYRVRTQNSAPDASVLFDSNETHIISLAVDRAGNLIAGTDPNGLVLRIDPSGKAFALYDAPLREIHELAVADDNSIYALALSDTASSTSQPATGAALSLPSGGAASVTVTSVSVVTAEDPNAAQATPSRSRNDLSAARSAVFRILPDGGTDVVWNSPNVTAFALAANPTGGALLGTADKGRIYQVANDGRETLLVQSNEGQISTFARGGNDVFAASSNQGKLYRFSSDRVNSTGVYESPVRDARFAALWGRISWNADNNQNIQLQTRTGNTEKPDATWSDWSSAYSNNRETQITNPRARYCQWRATLKPAQSAQDSPVLRDVTISYLPRNIAPEILGIQILPNNVGLQSTPGQPVDPNVEAIGLDPTVLGLPAAVNVPPRRLYQRAARSLLWTAEDRNGDDLEYAVYYRNTDDQNFRLLKANLRESFYTVDGASLSDGRYIFKIVASDAPAHSPEQNLSGERISEPVDFDSTAPTVQTVGAGRFEGNRVRVTFEVADATSYINRAEVSLNGTDWQPINSDDGISDGSRERYTLDLAVNGGVNVNEQLIAFRATDANGNQGSARALIRR